MAEKRAHLIISGRVQGVYYRYSTQQEAKRLGLTGWVRNLPNGNVEAVVEGDEATVGRMIEWCRQGPAGAVVSKIEQILTEASGEFKEFETRY
ncbi:MAG: acylphosphatase [Deltaproteobacteria bacterium]|nr:acylphosphatase [Deltaproteobacteria bacterium]